MILSIRIYIYIWSECTHFIQRQQHGVGHVILNHCRWYQHLIKIHTVHPDGLIHWFVWFKYLSIICERSTRFIELVANDIMQSASIFTHFFRSNKIPYLRYTFIYFLYREDRHKNILGMTMQFWFQYWGWNETRNHSCEWTNLFTKYIQIDWRLTFDMQN